MPSFITGGHPGPAIFAKDNAKLRILDSEQLTLVASMQKTWFDTWFNRTDGSNIRWRTMEELKQLPDQSFFKERMVDPKYRFLKSILGTVEKIGYDGKYLGIVLKNIDDEAIDTSDVAPDKEPKPGIVQFCRRPASSAAYQKAEYLVETRTAKLDIQDFNITSYIMESDEVMDQIATALLKADTENLKTYYGERCVEKHYAAASAAAASCTTHATKQSARPADSVDNANEVIISSADNKKQYRLILKNAEFDRDRGHYFQFRVTESAGESSPRSVFFTGADTQCAIIKVYQDGTVHDESVNCGASQQKEETSKASAVRNALQTIFSKLIKQAKASSLSELAKVYDSEFPTDCVLSSKVAVKPTSTAASTSTASATALSGSAVALKLAAHQNLSLGDTLIKKLTETYKDQLEHAQKLLDLEQNGASSEILASKLSEIKRKLNSALADEQLEELVKSKYFFVKYLSAYATAFKANGYGTMVTVFGRVEDGPFATEPNVSRFQFIHVVASPAQTEDSKSSLSFLIDLGSLYGTALQLVFDHSPIESAVIAEWEKNEHSAFLKATKEAYDEVVKISPSMKNRALMTGGNTKTSMEKLLDSLKKKTKNAVPFHTNEAEMGIILIPFGTKVCHIAMACKGGSVVTVPLELHFNQNGHIRDVAQIRQDQYQNAQLNTHIPAAPPPAAHSACAQSAESKDVSISSQAGYSVTLVKQDQTNPYGTHKNKRYHLFNITNTKSGISEKINVYPDERLVTDTDYPELPPTETINWAISNLDEILKTTIADKTINYKSMRSESIVERAAAAAPQRALRQFIKDSAEKAYAESEQTETTAASAAASSARPQDETTFNEVRKKSGADLKKEFLSENISLKKIVETVGEEVIKYRGSNYKGVLTEKEYLEQLQKLRDAVIQLNALNKLNEKIDEFIVQTLASFRIGSVSFSFTINMLNLFRESVGYLKERSSTMDPRQKEDVVRALDELFKMSYDLKSGAAEPLIVLRQFIKDSAEKAYAESEQTETMAASAAASSARPQDETTFNESSRSFKAASAAAVNKPTSDSDDDMSSSASTTKHNKL